MIDMRTRLLYEEICSSQVVMPSRPGTAVPSALQRHEGDCGDLRSSCFRKAHMLSRSLESHQGS
jgi:hypothetical protein